MGNLIKSFGATVLFAMGTLIGIQAGEIVFEERIGPWMRRKLKKDN